MLGPNLQYQQKNHGGSEELLGSFMSFNKNGSIAEKYSILLVQLPLPTNWKHKKIVPMGLAYIASSLLKDVPGVSVEILDAQVNGFCVEYIPEMILSKKPDMLGITYWTVQSGMAKKLSEAVKSLDRNVVIVHGGTHPTICPDDALESADYCVIGEGEKTFSELVRVLKNGGRVEGVKGVAYRKGGICRLTKPRPLIENLDELPFPALHLLDLEKYNSPLHIVGGRRLPIIGSRGCPYNCSFCVSPLIWKRRVRYRSPENVIEEMKHDIKEYGISQFHFWDDNITMNREYIIRTCRLIIRERLKIKWVALDRASHINKNKDILPLMKMAGCVGIELGVESANADTMLYLNKNQGIFETMEAVENQKKAGLYPLYTYMAFNPGESINGYYLQKEFLDKIQGGLPWYKYFHPLAFPVYIGQFATPYPGTKFYEDAPKLGMVLIEKPEDRYHQQINFVPNSLLEDVPMRTRSCLKKGDYRLFLLLYYTGIWEDFRLNESFGSVALKFGIIRLFLDRFYEKCDGSLSIKEIASELSKEMRLPMIRCVRMAAYSTYILAQVGLLRSSKHNKEMQIEPKDIEIVIPEELKIFDRYIKFIGQVPVNSEIRKCTMSIILMLAQKSLDEQGARITAQSITRNLGTSMKRIINPALCF